MRKSGILGTMSSLAILALLIILVYSLMGVDTTGVELYEGYQNQVGTKIIIKEDTLMIIDFSFINSTYILDDGRTISVELVKKLKIVE